LTQKFFYAYLISNKKFHIKNLLGDVVDNEEQFKKNAARSRELALSIIPHVDAIQQILGPEARISLAAVFKNIDGHMSDFVLGNGDFIEASFIFLKSEMERASAEGVVDLIPRTNDNNTKH
jgi:hypothetical protein